MKKEHQEKKQQQKKKGQQKKKKENKKRKERPKKQEKKTKKQKKGKKKLSYKSNDYKLGDEHYEDIEKFMAEMFPNKTGNDYNMEDDPDVETFIIKEEKPIMMGCRMQYS